MTCSIAWIKDNKITLGTDSQMTRGNHKDSEEKMLCFEDVLYVLGSGNMADIHLFFNELVRVFRKDKGISFKIVEEAYKSTVKIKKDFTTDFCDSTIFVCVYGRLFVIYYDGFIQEYSKDDTIFVASGSGMEYAYGAHYMGATVEQCLEASAKYDTSTSAPFTIVTL